MPRTSTVKRTRGIVCPDCDNGITEVLETRAAGEYYRRRRACPHCNARFTTYEFPASSLADLKLQLPQDGQSRDPLPKDAKTIPIAMHEARLASIAKRLEQMRRDLLDSLSE
jgi:transcriptional regulator NrdR family protein